MYVRTTLTYESHDVESLFLVCGDISGDKGHLRIWRSSGQGQGHSSKKARNFLFPQCKTSIGNNSFQREIQPWCLHAAWGFRLWRIECCDRHLCHVTGNACIRGWSVLDQKVDSESTTNTTTSTTKRSRTWLVMRDVIKFMTSTCISALTAELSRFTVERTVYLSWLCLCLY